MTTTPVIASPDRPFSQPKLLNVPHITRWIARFSTLVSTLFTLAFIALQNAVPAQAQIRIWSHSEGEVYYKSYDDGRVVQVASLKGIEAIFQNLLAIFTTVVGLAAFLMFIVGAFLYLTSGGNSKGTEAAKNSITYGIIGLIVALMAFFILQVIATFTGVDAILEFNLGLGN